MTADPAEAIVIEVRADLEDLEALSVGAAIFENARARFGEMKYGTEVARMLANWHLRHVELALTVCESFLHDRRASGFVAVRPIFETAMTLAWIITVSDEAEDQYPNLLTLLDGDAVNLALRLQSKKASVVQRAERDLEDRDEDGRQFVEEAISVGSRRLPGLRTRIADAEEVFHETAGEPSRLFDAYEDYRVLSGYGHPTGDGNPYELDEEGNLRKRQIHIGRLVPMSILFREMPLLVWILAEVSGWGKGVLIGKAINDSWLMARQKFLESHSGIYPEIALRIWGWHKPVLAAELETGSHDE
jgi:hypothetical protein